VKWAVLTRATREFICLVGSVPRHQPRRLPICGWSRRWRVESSVNDQKAVCSLYSIHRKSYFRVFAFRELALGGGLFLSACGEKAAPIDGDDGGGTTFTSDDGESSNSTSSITNASTQGSNVSPAGSSSATSAGQDAGQVTSPELDASSGDECGREGHPCCARSSCDDGLVCVDEPSSVEDAGLVVFDGGRNNQVLVDGGSTFDGGSFDAGNTSVPTTLDAGDSSEFVVPTGVCAPCGAEDERCCAQGTCDQGLSCETSGLGMEAVRSCIDVGCGAVGEQCCPGDQGGECDDGLICNDRRGDGLENSECEPGASSADAGQTENEAGASSEPDAAAACGGLDQACCTGRGAQCEDGLECERRRPAGREGDVCVEE
jgi:hypothetical protein